MSFPLASARKLAEYWQIADDSDAETFRDDVAATTHARSLREQVA
jgi:hypothetical protein